MTISSRTPEGWPTRCTICGAEVVVDPSDPPGDVPCPRCGQLLWWFRNRLEGYVDESTEIGFETGLANVGADSLDLVELVMELEEEFDIEITEDEASHVHTVADAIRLIEERRGRTR